MRTRIAVGVTVKDDRDGMRILLDALAKQTRAPDELVLVDAASIDGTREEIEAFARTAPFPTRVEIFPCTRGGGRRRIVELADADLVAFTDSDCVPPPDWLARLEQAWRAAAPGTAALGGPNRSEGTPNGLQRAVEDVMAHTEAASFGGVNTCNAIYDKGALLDAGNFDATLQTAEDPDMNARLVRKGRLLARSDVAVLQRRRSTWGSLVRQHYEYGKGALTLLRRYPGDFPPIEPWVGPILLGLAVLLLFAGPGGWLVAALLVGGVPLVVHRRLAARFYAAHGLSGDLWRRLGVVWVAYVPYHAGILVARL